MEYVQSLVLQLVQVSIVFSTQRILQLQQPKSAKVAKLQTVKTARQTLKYVLNVHLNLDLMQLKNHARLAAPLAVITAQKVSQSV